MNASAVDPLHVAEQRVPPPIRYCDKPAYGVRGMQAGGLAAQSVNVLTSTPPSLAAPRARLATRLGDFATNRHE